MEDEKKPVDEQEKDVERIENENKPEDAPFSSESVEEEEENDNGIDVEKTSEEELAQLIENKDRKGLIEVFDKVPTIDIAEAANDLSPEQLIYIFRNLSSALTADLFDGFTPETKEKLIKAMTDRDLVKIINSQSADDVADTVGGLPANLASKVLRAADKDMRDDINQLLKYKEDTAGSLMTTEYIELLDTTRVDKAIQEIREKGRDAETVYTIFVRDKFRHFEGTVDLDDLIFAKPDEKLSDIMNEDVVSVSTGTDQEEIGEMFSRYDLNALAVLNDDDRLVGVITIDDAVDVIKEESSEDLARITNMEPSDRPYTETSIWSNAKKCFPWIIALLILGTFTTMVLNRLESQTIFTSLPILISFVPTLMDTGGNAGGQTTGLMIRGLAIHEFGPKETLKIVWKEIRSALIVACFVAAFAFLWVAMEEYTGIVNMGKVIDSNGLDFDFSGMTIWNGTAFTGKQYVNDIGELRTITGADFASHSLIFAALVAITMFAAITFSKAIGTLLCMASAAIKKDPAMLAQPLLTTVMDVATLLIYFAMACAFFPKFA